MIIPFASSLVKKRGEAFDLVSRCEIWYTIGKALQASTVESPKNGGALLNCVPDAPAKGVRLMYVTYSDLVQLGLLICAIIGLCLTYKKK